MEGTATGPLHAPRAYLPKRKVDVEVARVEELEHVAKVCPAVTKMKVRLRAQGLQPERELRLQKLTCRTCPVGRRLPLEIEIQCIRLQTALAGVGGQPFHALYSGVAPSKRALTPEAILVRACCGTHQSGNV